MIQSKETFWSGGGERWTIDSTGTLTTGSVPWARLTSFPSDCLAGQYVSGIGSALICSTPAGGDITAVTAGTGLTGGGTEGDVTLNVDDSRFINTTGDDLMTGKLTISRNIDDALLLNNTVSLKNYAFAIGSGDGAFVIKDDTTVRFKIDTSGNVSVANLTSANCDVKASVSGVLSCGTDAVDDTNGFVPVLMLFKEEEQ